MWVYRICLRIPSLIWILNLRCHRSFPLAMFHLEILISQWTRKVISLNSTMISSLAPFIFLLLLLSRFALPQQSNSFPFNLQKDSLNPLSLQTTTWRTELCALSFSCFDGFLISTQHSLRFSTWAKRNFAPCELWKTHTDIFHPIRVFHFLIKVKVAFFFVLFRFSVWFWSFPLFFSCWRIVVNCKWGRTIEGVNFFNVWFLYDPRHNSPTSSPPLTTSWKMKGGWKLLRQLFSTPIAIENRFL